MNNIEILEEKLKNVKKYNIYSYSWTEQDIEAIENLIQENKELKNENEKLTYARNWYFEHFASQACTPEQLHKILRFDYIPKSKIEKALDKMNERYMTPEAISNSNGATFNYWTGKRDMCIELLEEGE